MDEHEAGLRRGLDVEGAVERIDRIERAPTETFHAFGAHTRTGARAAFA